MIDLWDAIIIGGGLAGLAAGIRGAERGKQVIIVAEGTGSLPNASGTLDFGDFSRLVKQSNHPYCMLGEDNIRRAWQYFQSVFPQYQTKWGGTDSVLTPLGEVRPAGLVTPWLSAHSLAEAERIMILSPAGMKDFFPEIFAANLAQSFPLARITNREMRCEAFEAWHRCGKSVSALDYHRYWHSPDGVRYLRELLAGIVRHNSAPKTAVVFPGLSVEFSPSLQNVLREFPFPVVETTLFPPSPAGSALRTALQAKFKALGGEVLIGGRVIGAEVKNGVCRSVRVASTGKGLSLAAKSFVLAGGGIFGGGIETGSEQVREPVFDLPLYMPAEWTKRDFLGEQPYAYTGVEVDSKLRPLDAAGRVIMPNVRVCGRMLAHWDPWTEHCGGGVSLTSGLVAGESI